MILYLLYIYIYIFYSSIHNIHKDLFINSKPVNIAFVYECIVFDQCERSIINYAFTLNQFLIEERIIIIFSINSVLLVIIQKKTHDCFWQSCDLSRSS